MTATVTVDVHDVYSLANDRRFTVWSWRPDGPGPFPLLVLLHGVWDSGGHGWWRNARVHEQVAALARSGILTDPPVIVMPPDTGASGGTSYADWIDGTTNAETFIADELLDWASRTFPLDGRRWISGLSMGGYGALLLALRHPGMFVSATSTSGYFDPRQMLAYVPDRAERIWGNVERLDAHNVATLLEDPHRRAGLRIAFDCGTDDPHLDDNRSMHARLAELGVDHGYAEHPGGHTWEYWHDHIADHVRFHAGLTSPLGDVVGSAR
jgi:putative tributyrin esterase